MGCRRYEMNGFISTDKIAVKMLSQNRSWGFSLLWLSSRCCCPLQSGKATYSTHTRDIVWKQSKHFHFVYIRSHCHLYTNIYESIKHLCRSLGSLYFIMQTDLFYWLIPHKCWLQNCKRCRYCLLRYCRCCCVYRIGYMLVVGNDLYGGSCTFRIKQQHSSDPMLWDLFLCTFLLLYVLFVQVQAKGFSEVKTLPKSSLVKLFAEINVLYLAWFGVVNV